MQKKIKIAYIIDELNIGGTEKQLVSTIELLDKNQFEVLLICLRPSQYFFEIDLQCKKILLDVSSLISINGALTFFSLVSCLRKHEVDIVQTYFFDANVFGILAAKFSGVKRIISCRRDMGFWYTPKLLFVLRRLNKLTDRFLVNSNAIKENITKHELIPAYKIDVIHNGIDLKPFQNKYDSEMIKNKLGINHCESVVGIVANLNRKVKRVDLFIHAAKNVLRKNRDVSFIIVGDGHLRNILEECSIHLGIKDKIFFVGQKEDIRPYLSVFDVGVICSDSEGFSNSIIEYAASGVPIIATDTGGNRELLGKGDLGCLVPIGNSEKLADCILELLSDKSKLTKLSFNAKKTVNREYAWEVRIKEIEQYYCQILHGNEDSLPHCDVFMNSLNKKRLKILIPIRYPVGGIRTYLKYTHGSLDNNSFEFTFIAPSKVWLNRIRDDFSDHKVKIIFTKRDENSFSLFLAVFATLFKNKYDLIHSQGYTAGIISTVANWLFRLPHIITLHHIFGEEQFSNTFWHKYAFIKKYIIELILSRADVIQAVSNDARANLLDTFPGLNKSRAKICVIRNGIRIDLFTVSPSKIEKPFIRQKDTIVIGFLGRYMPEKGFVYLIETVDKLVNELGVCNIKVISVGGFGAFIREYQKEIQIKRLSCYFEFLDFFNNVALILKKVHLLTIPSLGEACGLLGMEALICGTPVIAFSCTGLREVLENTPAIMVPIRDSTAMAREIVKVINDYQNVKYQFDAFVPEAKRRFDVRAAAYSLERVFKGLIGR